MREGTANFNTYNKHNTKEKQSNGYIKFHTTNIMGGKMKQKKTSKNKNKTNRFKECWFPLILYASSLLITKWYCCGCCWCLLLQVLSLLHLNLVLIIFFFNFILFYCFSSWFLSNCLSRCCHCYCCYQLLWLSSVLVSVLFRMFLVSFACVSLIIVN